MASERFPYATKSRLWVPQNPLNGLKGVNVTASEQTTLPIELSGGQNTFTDMNGAIYNRSGSLLLGGIVDIVGSQGGWVFKDNEQRVAVITVIRGIIYHHNGSDLVPVVSAPTLSTTLAVQGIFYPEQDKFYLTNGTDSVVELDQSSGTLTAVSKPTMQKSLFLGHHQNSLVFINLPGQTNALIISDEGATTSSAALSTQITNGYLLGMANLDAYTSVVVTDQMAYRMTGITVNVDGFGNTGLLPGTFNEIYPSRAIAPRSIVTVNNRVYWIGLDVFNVAEIYMTDGQQVSPIGWSKIKTYLRDLNSSTLSNACAVQYGVYAKFAVPSQGSAYNDTELLLDTARSVGYTETGQTGPPQIVWENKHIPGYYVNQYAVYRTGGQDFVLGFDTTLGCIHRTGVGLFDELPYFSSFPESGSSPTLSTITVTSTTPISQPISVTVPESLVTIGLAVSAYATGGTVTFSLQADSGGHPSGVSLFSTSVFVSTTPPKVVHASFSPSAFMGAGNSYHLVTSVSAGSLTVTKQTPAVATVYQQKSGSVWSNGTGSPLMIMYAQTDLDCSFIHTTNLEQPLAKKKPSRFMVNGISNSGALMTLGLGNQGRDGTFTDTNFSLVGSSAVWGVSLGNQPSNVLVWAASGDQPSMYNTWSSGSPDYEKTVLPPWFSVPSYYLSIRFRCVGQSDWRINTYVPIVALIPTTVA